MDKLQAAFPQTYCDRQLALTGRMQVFQEKVGIDRAEGQRSDNVSPFLTAVLNRSWEFVPSEHCEPP